MSNPVSISIHGQVAVLHMDRPPVNSLGYDLRVGIADALDLANANPAVSAIVLTLAALVSRSASLLRNARLRPISTLQTATGIRHPRIVQKAQGAMGGSFNTREFFHGKSALMLRSVKWVFLVLVFLFYTFFDLLPKMLFRTYPNRLCVLMARPFRLIHLALLPLVMSDNHV